MLKSICAISPLLAVVAASASASPGYLQLDFEKREFVYSYDQDGVLVSRQLRDNGYVDSLLTQNTNRLEYLINITIGTPPQVS